MASHSAAVREAVAPAPSTRLTVTRHIHAKSGLDLIGAKLRSACPHSCVMAVPRSSRGTAMTGKVGRADLNLASMGLDPDNPDEFLK
jgi:hypothetical protein